MLCRATTCKEFHCVWFEAARAAATYERNWVNLVGDHGAKHPLGIHSEFGLKQEAENCVCERLFQRFDFKSSAQRRLHQRVKSSNIQINLLELLCLLQSAGLISARRGKTSVNIIYLTGIIICLVSCSVIVHLHFLFKLLVPFVWTISFRAVQLFFLLYLFPQPIICFQLTPSSSASSSLTPTNITFIYKSLICCSSRPPAVLFQPQHPSAEIVTVPPHWMCQNYFDVVHLALYLQYLTCTAPLKSSFLHSAHCKREANIFISTISF